MGDLFNRSSKSPKCPSVRISLKPSPIDIVIQRELEKINESNSDQYTPLISPGDMQGRRIEDAMEKGLLPENEWLLSKYQVRNAWSHDTDLVRQTRSNEKISRWLFNSVS